MSAGPKPPPRFLPTLTEVVHPPGMSQAPQVPAPDQEQLVERVMQRLDVSLEPLLRDVIGAMVQEQIRALEPLLQDKMALVVRQAVAEAVEREMHPGRSDGLR